MVTEDALREYIKDQLQADRNRKSVRVIAPSIDEALINASVELGLPKIHLQYEIEERGTSGFFGLGKKDWVLNIYEREKHRHDRMGAEGLDDMDLNTDILLNEDGYFTLHLAKEGAFLLVHEPVGTGFEVDLSVVLDELERRAVINFDKSEIIEIVNTHDGKFHKIGTFKHNSQFDASISLSVSSDELIVEIYVTEPGAGGLNITEDQIKHQLDIAGIVYGIRLDKIHEFIDRPIYNENYVVAEGLPAQDGEDSKIIYSFKQSNDIELKQDKEGKINFKELNRFTNVVEGQPLATIKPPGVGVDGKTVYGKYIPSQDGKEIEVKLGKNVSLVNNKTVVADESGQVVIINGKITVETILVIAGDVNVETGNINSLGSVLIEGNVEDGFNVNAQANIEINGYVGKSSLTSGGDIVVKQGINGGPDSVVSAGGSVWSSFITNCKVESGERVIVSDGIVNSHVDAAQKILCKGKRAKIVGGHLRAAVEINAAVIGSTGGTETIVEVGYDPKTKAEIEELEKQYKFLRDNLEEVNKNLHSLVRLKKQTKELSEEKENFLKDLKAKHNNLTKQIKNIREEIEEKVEYVKNLSISGLVAAQREVLPGVKIVIEDKDYDVKSVFKRGTSFVLEDGYIVTREYEEIKDSLERNSDNVN